MNKGEMNIRMTEILCSAAVIVFGEYNGITFEITPKLPTIFANGVDIDGIAYNANFLKVQLHGNGLVCWFKDEKDNTFFVPLHKLLVYAPLLYSAIITHIFTLIDYVDY